MAKILVAEDDRISQMLIQRVLEELGHIVFVSPDGEHAWEALQANEGFQLLITDIVMPRMDGRELIKTVRNDPKFKRLPILIMSGVIRLQEVSHLLELGASLFQPKPLNVNELKDNIRKCLSWYAGEEAEA